MGSLPLREKGFDQQKPDVSNGTLQRKDGRQHRCPHNNTLEIKEYRALKFEITVAHAKHAHQ